MKIALLNDTHFGARNDSNIFDEYFYKFYDNVFFPYLEKNNIKTLMKIKTPTLVLHGSADTLVDPSGGQRTAEVIPEARFVMIEGWGHDLPPGSWPKITNEIIKHVKNAENIS